MKTKDKILDYFETRKELTVKQISLDLSINRFIVKAIISDLSRAGVIKKVGKEGLVHVYKLGELQ